MNPVNYQFSTSRSSLRSIQSLRNKGLLIKNINDLTADEVVAIIEELKKSSLKHSTIIFTLNAIKRYSQSEEVKALVPKKIGLSVKKERDDERVGSVIKYLDSVITKAFNLIQSYEHQNNLNLLPHTSAAIGIVVCFLTNTRTNEITRLSINNLFAMSKGSKVTLRSNLGNLSNGKYSPKSMTVYMLNKEIWEKIKIGLLTAIITVNQNYKTTLKSANELMINSNRFTKSFLEWVNHNKDINHFPHDIEYEKILPITSTELNRQFKMWYITVTGERPKISLGLKRIRDYTSTKLQQQGFLELASCFARHKSTNSTIQYDKTSTSTITNQLNDLQQQNKNNLQNRNDETRTNSSNENEADLRELLEGIQSYDMEENEETGHIINDLIEGWSEQNPSPPNERFDNNNMDYGAI